MDVDVRDHLTTFELDGHVRFLTIVLELLHALPAEQGHVSADKVAGLEALEGEPPRFHVLEVRRDLRHRRQIHLVHTAAV